MDDPYFVEKIRGQHAFQISIAMKAIALVTDQPVINVVDIGDSAGTHISYLNALMKEKNLRIQSCSVNLDRSAVDRIRERGLKAILCRAEDLHRIEEGFNADIFMSFQMLEHLVNPIGFLHSMAHNSVCKYFVITIPYVNTSRVALEHIRSSNMHKGTSAENTHIFELCPEDWDLICQFSGWEIIYSEKYTQYPGSFPLSLMKYAWRKFDFDGFYGIILKQNLTYANHYKDWGSNPST